MKRNNTKWKKKNNNNNKKEKIIEKTKIIKQKLPKNEAATNRKKIKKWKICNGTYFWCASWCQSSKLQFAHGKGMGSIILTKQNRVATQEEQQRQQHKKNNKS